MENLIPKNNGLFDVYHDTAGTFLMEFVTKPLGLLSAAFTTCSLTKQIQEKAETANHRCAPSLDVTPDNENAIISPEYKHQIFSMPSEGHAKTEHWLVGRDQHANVSIWLDDRNLFNKNKIHKVSADVGVAMLPNFILPSRNGNYHRIAAKSEFSILSIESGLDAKNQCQAIRVVKQNKHPIKGETKILPHEVRLEFRQGAADADPYDVVLAAGVPMVKVCMETFERGDDGKVVLNESGQPIIIKEYAQPESIPMPKTQEEAAEMFNVKDNAYCTFLDTLAVRKLERLQAQKTMGTPNHALDKEVRVAQELQNIGTKMHHLYCHKYGIESAVLPPSPAVSIA